MSIPAEYHPSAPLPRFTSNRTAGALIGASIGAQAAENPTVNNLLGSAKLDLNASPFKSISQPGDRAPSNAVIAPLSNTGGATIGGLGGVALGGLAGLGRAAFDGEDDGILSTLRKALVGAGVGGLGGAALGAGASTLLRGKAVDRLTKDNPERFDTDAKRDSVDAVVRRHKVPLAALWDTIRSNSSMEDLRHETSATNVRESMMSLLAPFMASSDSYKGVKNSDTGAALAARLPEFRLK